MSTLTFNDPDTAAAPAKGEDAMLAFLSFRCGAVRYALPAHAVSQIVPQGAVAPVPGTPPFVLGLLHTQGRIVVLLDPAELLGIGGGPAPGEAPRRDLVLAHGSAPFALRVDEVFELVEVPAGALGSGSRTIALGEGAVTVLDPEALLRLAEERVEGT